MSDDERWSAVLRRDPHAADAFVYAVKTTGVACRPSCASRAPRRENVEFFDRLPLAVRAGYRPCKRCHPAPSKAAKLVIDACRLLGADDEGVRTEEVATALGVQSSQLVRSFRARLGITPQQYRRRILAQRARTALRSHARVTDALYEAGYSSSSRFYDGAGKELGMRPKDARDGGRGKTVCYALRETTLGLLAIAWTDRGVCGVFFAEGESAARRELERLYGAAMHTAKKAPPWLARIIVAVEQAKRVDVPLDIQGTAFQARVWEALRKIPFGKTRSYEEISRAIGAPNAQRAVARACAENKLAVLVPCHRAIGKNGALCGYRWKIARKRELLRRETKEDGRS